MAIHPDEARRHIVPDEAQLQIILGSLLGRARIRGGAGQRWMDVALEDGDHDYVWWKYEHLAAFTLEAPRRRSGGIGFRTIVHPIFDDLVPLLISRQTVRRRLAPLGLAVWMSDVGRVRLRAALFLPERRLGRCA